MSEFEEMVIAMAYAAGYDRGFNGRSEINCQGFFIATPEREKAYYEGKTEGVACRMREDAKRGALPYVHLFERRDPEAG